MARWQQWPVIDGAYADDARPWSSQDTCNWLPAPAEQAGTRSAVILRTPPGLVEFCDLGTDAPIRGAHDVEGLLLAVSDTTLFRISTAGVATAIGTIPGVGRVSMDHTPRGAGFHVGIANGQSGYIYDTATDSLTQITDEGFPGATIFQFIDGYLAFLEPFGKFWGHSELNDGLSYNTLDRYTAESAPDGIRSLIVSHREVFTPGDRSGEFFRNTGAATGTFQRADGYEMERGIASPYAITRVDNTLVWLGDNGVAYKLEGHQPVRISTGPIEQAFARSNLANAFAFTWEDKSHQVVYFTLPDGQTWGWDAWTGKWHRRQSYGLNRWRLSTLTRWNDQWIGGDYTNGKLYTLTWAEDNVHEAGQPLVSERTFPVAHDFGNDLIVNGIRVLLDTGKRGPGAPTIMGNLPGGFVGDAVSGAYTVTGGFPPYSAIMVTSGSLPPGITLNSNGTYSGTFTTAGVYAWTVGGTDSLGTPFSLNDGATVEEVVWFTSSTTGVVQSPDGLDWLAAPAVDAGASIFSAMGKVVNVRYAAGIAVGETSSDGGDTWVPHTGLSAESCSQGCYTGTHYVIAANNRAINRSPDGVTYSNALVPSGVLNTNNVAITNIGGTVLIGGSQDPNTKNVAVSTDHAATWTSSSMAFTGTGSRDVFDLANDGARVVAVGRDGASGKMAYSDDNGGSWTQIAPPFADTTSTVQVVACGTVNGAVRWVAANAAGEIGYSDDGETWSLSADSLGALPYGADCGGNRFILVGDDRMATSSNGGVTWTPLVDNQTGTITGVTPLRPA